MKLTSSLQAFYFHDFANAHIPEIFKEIYLDQIYRPYFVGKRDLTIVDVGANIGLTSYYFKEYGNVYSLEPTPGHLEAFKSMVDQNQITNITICPYALSNVSGKSKFYLNQNSTMNMLDNIVAFNSTATDVLTLNITDFMAKYKLDKIDFMKLDVEGFEGQIIASDSFKKECPKINTIVGEWHAWSSMGKQVFENAFKSLGYDFRWLTLTEASTFAAVRI